MRGERFEKAKKIVRRRLKLYNSINTAHHKMGLEEKSAKIFKKRHMFDCSCWMCKEYDKERAKRKDKIAELIEKEEINELYE